MIPVSVVIPIRNEAANLPACLHSVATFSEVFVVDSDSSDGSAALAAAAGAHVVPFHWNGRYPKKKQWCLDNLPFTNDWVLLLDADERLTPALVDEIARRVREPGDCAGFFLRGQPVFLGRTLRHGGGFAKLALFDRRAAAFAPVDDLDVTRMWEVEGHYQPAVLGRVGHLRHPYLHDDRKPPFFWFERHNRYSDWEASLRARGRQDSLSTTEKGARHWLKRLFHRLPCRPLLVFLREYAFALGFLDGRAGLNHALARAFYYWQVDMKTQALTRPDSAPARPPKP